MARRQLKRGELDGTRGEILQLLRRAPSTANDLAAELGFSHNAIRLHLGVLLADGLIRESGMRPSSTRPAALYELTHEADTRLSRAYVPFITHLMRVLGRSLSRERLEGLMRDVGRDIASEWPPLRGDLRQRVAAASSLLEELGAPNDVEENNGSFVIRGHGCVLAAAVNEQKETCHSIETLLQDLLEAPVRACCECTDRPRCCFQVGRALS